MIEVLSNMPLVPGNEDGLNAREIPVERGAANTCCLGDLGHGHRPQPMLGNQCRGRIEDGVMHLAAMRLDGLVPELRDQLRIRHGHWLDTLYCW